MDADKEKNKETDKADEVNNQNNSCGTAALVLGIVGICLSFIPILNYLSIILGLLAAIFGSIGMAIKGKKGNAIAGFALSLVTLLIAFIVIYGANSNSSNTSNSTNQSSNSGTSTVQQQDNTVSIGQVMTGKDVEASIVSAAFAQDVLPPKTNSYLYSHYEVDDSSNTYLYVVLDCKNISTINLDADSVAKVTVKYKGSYTYTSFSAIPDDTLGFTIYKTIKPLTNQQIYFLAEMPKSIADETDTPVEIDIKIDNTTYVYQYR